MSDEAMQEEVSTTQEASTTETPEQEVTLDDVYKSAGIEESRQQPIQPQPQVQSKPQYQPPQIPDAFDTEAHRQFLANQQIGLQTVAGSVSQMANYLSQVQQREMKAQLEKDISTAVSTVNEVVGHPKPKVIEAMLDAKARENPKFQALWNQRHNKPDAWNQALKAVAREFSKELEVQVDPKLVQSQQARRIAQKQMATTAKDSNENEWDGISEADFGQKWEYMKSQGG